MHMPEIQSVLNEKNISFSYVEEDNCGSIDFEHRGLRYHIWEFADDVEPVGVEIMTPSPEKLVASTLSQ